MAVDEEEEVVVSETPRQIDRREIMVERVRGRERRVYWSRATVGVVIIFASLYSFQFISICKMYFGLGGLKGEWREKEGGLLVETDRIICQTQVPENQEPGEERT